MTREPPAISTFTTRMLRSPAFMQVNVPGTLDSE